MTVKNMVQQHENKPKPWNFFLNAVELRENPKIGST